MAHTAHIVDVATKDPVAAGSILLVAGGIGFVLWLIAQDHLTKHDGFSWPSAKRTLGVVLALACGAVLAPSASGTQDQLIPVGLPDLVSDPPYIWFDRLVEDEDGTVIKVLAFDGYLHNIGQGMLEVIGNPQEPGDIRQRYYDGDDWVDVGPVRVQYETNDGHNHFHLMNASEYELWNEARTEKVGDASKVGFCLLDSYLREDRYPDFYDINTIDYCEKDSPESTTLRMGISPGWVDIYDANTTLQWVDVSNIKPGWFWVTSVIDPEDQVLESDETNNGAVFSQNKYPVTGYVARELTEQRAGEPITLKANIYGQVGRQIWTIVDGPEHGQLNVPTGVDLFTSTVTYIPEPGFDGVDSFRVATHDLDSDYPLVPNQVTVQVDANDYPGPPAPEPTPTDVRTVELEPFDTPWFRRNELDVTAAFESAIADSAVHWYSRDLPPGFWIDRETGVIQGVAVRAEPTSATIIALANDGSMVTAELAWTTTLDGRDSIDDLNHVSIRHNERTRLNVGTRTDGATYTATGLPAGLSATTNIPLIAGTATEIGTFDIELFETVDGQITDSTSFTMTVRPSATPAFVL